MTAPLTEKTRVALLPGALATLAVAVFVGGGAWYSVAAQAAKVQDVAAVAKEHEKEIRELDKRTQRLEDAFLFVRETLEKMDKKLDRRGGR